MFNVKVLKCSLSIKLNFFIGKLLLFLKIHQKTKQFRKPKKKVNLLVVVLFAINVPIPTKAGDFTIEALPAVRTLETGSVPSPLHGLEIEPVRYSEATTSTNDPRDILQVGGWCWWRFQLGYRVKIIRAG